MSNSNESIKKVQNESTQQQESLKLEKFTSSPLIIQEQPVLTSQMTRTASSAALLNPKNLPFDESTDEREFAKGIFKIDENCVIACLLPCVVYSSVNSRWNSLNEKNEPIQDPEIVGEDCGIFWLFACCGLSVFLSTPQRADVRKRYHIAGSLATDAALSCCCLPCSLSQLSNEIGNEETAFRLAQQAA